MTTAPEAPPAPPSDAELLDAFVTSVDEALEQIDADPEMTATDQLSTLVVGAARGVMPLLRVERDRLAAEDART